MSSQGTSRLAETDQASAYDELLKQVESLKVEHSSLKNELNFKAAQICRLESEASCLKKMVIKLGNTINKPTLPSDHRVHSHINLESFASPNLLPNTNLDIRLKITSLQQQRQNVMECLTKEEAIKDSYMKKLNKLNEKLKSMLSCCQSPDEDEKATVKLKRRIVEVEEQMVLELGTHDMMKQRVKDWLQKMNVINFNLKKLRCQLGDGDVLQECLLDNNEILLPVDESDIEDADCSIIQTSKSPISTQTPNCSHQFLEIPNKCFSSNSDFVEHGNVVTRAMQTNYTCLQNKAVPSLDAFDDVLHIATSLSHQIRGTITSAIRFTNVNPNESFDQTVLHLLKTTEACITKVDVYALISKVDRNNPELMSQILFAISVKSAGALRQAGCLPLIVNLLHNFSILHHSFEAKEEEKKKIVRRLALQSLHNIVQYNPNEEQKETEWHMLQHLEVIQAHCEAMHEFLRSDASGRDKCDMNLKKSKQIPPATSNDVLRSVHVIMAHSYYKPARLVINMLGGLQNIAELFILDWDCCENETQQHLLLQHQCIGLTLTNLTFADPSNKVILVKMPRFLESILLELQRGSEDLQQTMASILRNLSWKSGEHERKSFHDRGVVKVVVNKLMNAKGEATLKGLLGALWNLSSHSLQNHENICSIKGALAFLVSLLTYSSPSKSLQVAENAGGILRNVSSVVLKYNQHRKVMRASNCLEILLNQLESPSLTIVSNACGILWNLSSRDSNDWQRLIELGAIEKLRKLVHSKHELIAQGSVGALQNLLDENQQSLESKKVTPSLQACRLQQLQHVDSTDHYQVSDSVQNVPQQSPMKVMPIQLHGFQEHQLPKSPSMNYSHEVHSRKFTTSIDNNSQHSFISKRACQQKFDHAKEKKCMQRGAQTHTFEHAHSVDNSTSNTNEIPCQFEQRPVRTLGKTVLSTRDINPATTFQTKSVGGSSSGMPTDLVEKLQHAYNDFSMEDDNPINYSLQYTETELNISPSFQNCHYAEYSNSSHNTFAQPLHAEPCASTGKCGKGNSESTTTACLISRPPHSLPKLNFFVEDKILSAEAYETEDTPTNFGAIYTEECLNDECLEDYSSQQYNKLGKGAADGNECVKNYNVEDTPICFSIHSSLSDLHSSSPSRKTHEETSCAREVDSTNGALNDMMNKKHLNEEYPSDEEVDKFDLEPGIITPAHYLKSNRHSGLMTPRTPMCQDTPMMMYSPSESRSSLDSCDQASICSDVSSGPESRLQSGCISPSELPDSPGQSVPQSRCRSPYNADKSKEKHMDEKCSNKVMINQLKTGNPVFSTLKGFNVNEKSPSEFSSALHQRDEIKHYHAEPAMSVMTDLSELTVDGEKIEFSMKNLSSGNNVKVSENTNNNNHSKDMEKLSEGSNQAVLQAGYITSLPTSDEIKHFHAEGAMSPFTGLSEISALHSHNDGFQKTPYLGLGKLKRNETSNRNSYASRSSATGASVPLSPISQEEDEDINSDGKTRTGMLGKMPPGTSHDNNSNDLSNSLKNNDSAVSEISTELTTSMKTATKQIAIFGESTIEKDVLLQTKTKPVESLQTPGYCTSLPSCDEIKLYYSEEGTMSPLTTLSEISILKSHNEGFQETIQLLSTKSSTSLKVKFSEMLGKVGSFNNENENCTKVFDECLDDNVMDVNTSDFLDSSTDDDGLLEQVIKSAIPRNRSSNRSKTTKSTGSFNRKDKSVNKQSSKHIQKAAMKKNGYQINGKKNEAATKLDTAHRITAADARLNGIGILDYIESKMAVEGSSYTSAQCKSSREFNVVGPVNACLSRNQVFEESISANVSSYRDGIPPVVDGYSKLTGDDSQERTHNEAGIVTNIFDYQSQLTNATENQSDCLQTEGSSIGNTMPDVSKQSDYIDQDVSQIGVTNFEQRSSAKINDEDSSIGSNSSLSSLGTDEGSKLLNDCISSAMPVARKDFTTPIPPKQLVEQNQSILLETSSTFDFLQPGGSSLAVGHQQPEAAATCSQTSISRNCTHFNDLTVGTNELYLSRVVQSDLAVSDSSTGSLKLGGDAKSLMKSQNRTKSCKNFDFSTKIPPVHKGGKTMHQIMGKPQDVTCYASHSKEENSSKSSSNRCIRNRTSESSLSPCSKCNPSASCKLPSSSSVSKVENVPRRRRKSSHTKAAVATCGHVLEMRKPVRSRSALTNHYPGVTQIYPRLKEIDSIVLTGVASMAARGERVQCDGGQWVPVTFASGYSPHTCSALQTPLLLKQATFIPSQPNQSQLQSGFSNLSDSRKVANDLPASKTLRKQQLSPKKKNSLKNRIKKLISPSDETKSVKINSKKKVFLAEHNIAKQPMKEIPWKGMSSCGALNRPDNTKNESNHHSSSLSLSSSSANSKSSDSLDAYGQMQSRTSIYPTVSSITSNHIPKSPALRTRMSVAKSSHKSSRVPQGNCSTSTSLKSDNGNMQAHT